VVNVYGLADAQRKMTPFAEKLATVQQARQTDLALYLKPQLSRMPLPIQVL
jgi:hypothetical protein